jgi:NhaP-type Na+/H+ or K+/H+ antiporter
VAAGLVSGAIVVLAGRRGLITDSWLQVIPVAAAALAYGVAAALGGSGFIAAFLAGAIYGGIARREVREAGRLSEEIGSLLDGVTFLVFGAVLLGPALSHLSWKIALYAVLSLTVVRLLPVAIAMYGTRARAPTVAFVGWFGPRGLASIVFAVIVVQESALPQTSTILVATYATVGLSVLLHGLSAAPLAARYARWYESHPPEALPPMESAAAAGTRVRATPAGTGAPPGTRRRGGGV